jgi:hypothetical protein
MLSIKDELTLIKSNYDRTIDLVEGLPFSQKRQIRTIEFYNHSKYLNGQKDELGREKPFMQILNAICDVENAAKDLDTKDINITSDDGNHYLESWLLSKDIQVWMKEVNFAKTLNDMRDMHTRYGSLLVKKVIKNGELTLELPEWKNLITDQVDIIQGAIVETHYMTAMEIAKMSEWDKDKIKQLLNKLKGKGSNKRIPIYEVRGEFSKATYKECIGEKYKDSDEIEFSYQLYYVAGLPQESGKQQTFDGLVPLYWEDNTERVYKYLARKPKAGRGFGVGVMEEGEEAQVWTNDAILKQHRAMEYTTKVVGQSASKKLKGRNLLTETDDGTILETEDNKPITALNLLPSGGLAQYNNLITQWYTQLEKTTSAYSAQRGETPPSGTPFRLQATVLQQSSSVFKSLQQELGIFITEIIEDWVMPHLASKLNREHILAYNFSPEELKEIDNKFTTKQANQRAVEAILSGKMVTQEEYDGWIENYDEFIKQTKSQRFIEIPKNFYKNLKAKITVNITGEQRNKAATLESLNNILITYASNPNLSQDPVASQLLTRIIELSGAGISPVQITGAISEKAKKDAETMEQNAMMQGQEQAVPSPMSLEANPTPA